jgi:hypothetical protein
MNEIINNVTVHAVVDKQGKWRYQGNVPPADEVIIRQITYGSPSDTISVYLIHSNINNGIIGSAIKNYGFVSNPGTRIQLRNPLPNYLEFQLLAPTYPTGSPVAPDVADDMVTISMDFIKYVR